MFQSTHPHGVRLLTKMLKQIMLRFNPRTHTGCDTKSRLCSRTNHFVSIHAPTRGATRTSLLTQYFSHGFNPRTHTGCDQYVARMRERFRRFNPRTHTGCDPSGSQRLTSLLLFQSTHPHGVRLTSVCYQIQPRDVSIHAPTRGATVLCKLVVILICFNPRTHTGCDLTMTLFWVTLIRFQSTHPHGVRR